MPTIPPKPPPPLARDVPGHDEERFPGAPGGGVLPNVPKAVADAFRPAAEKPKGVTVEPSAAELAAVQKMRGLVRTGQVARYYEGAIGLNPGLQGEALELFKALPKITNANSAEDLVAYGLWERKPEGIALMQASPRYLPGRQVLVETTVNPDPRDWQGFMAWKQDGRLLRTYRATLVGEQGDDFLVKVDGKPDPISVPKERIYALNQPHLYKGDQVQFRRDVYADYASPLMKAKIAEAAIRMAPHVSMIDFTQNRDQTPQQRMAQRAVHDVINMKYPKPENYALPGRSMDHDAGRQAACGIGSCFKQGGVLMAILNPFREMIGLDAQFVAGRTYTHLRMNPNADPFTGGEHGWLQLTYRPSMEPRVSDRTWRRPDQPLDEAYSLAGRRYPQTFVTTAVPAPLKPTDVNMTGQVSLKAGERKFGVEGQAGREIHQEFEP